MTIYKDIRKLNALKRKTNKLLRDMSTKYDITELYALVEHQYIDVTELETMKKLSPACLGIQAIPNETYQDLNNRFRNLTNRSK